MMKNNSWSSPHLHFMNMKWISQLLLSISLLSPLSAFALFEACQDLFPNQQVPSSPQAGRDLCFDSFAVYYSPSDKKPIYTVEKLNGTRLAAPHPRRTNQFYEEARLPFRDRALLTDYRASGYDRGHNAPAGDMSNERAMAQSFSLANMMPQARQNNQGIWAKNVEEPTRQYAKRVDGDLYVFTGSTGKIGRIGKGQVTIPEHLFKLVYEPSKNTAWAYWVENTNDATMSPPITYQDLKEKTGLDFHLPEDVAPLRGKKVNQAHQNQQPLVGGWYPVFFDGYSSSKVQEILESIKADRISSIQIQYDRNVELAKKLLLEIQSKTSLQVSLSQNSPPESKTVTYERDRVTAIIRTK